MVTYSMMGVIPQRTVVPPGGNYLEVPKKDKVGVIYLDVKIIVDLRKLYIVGKTS